MLASNDDRVPSICEALRAFITRNRMIAADPMAVDKHNLPFRGVSQQQARDNLTFLAAYAQHILPPLFGKFVELHGAVAEVTKAEVATMNVSPAQMRDAVLETVRTWIGVADQAVINRFFEATMTKYLATAEGDDAPAADDKVAIAAATSQKHALFDLTLAILASKRLEVPAVQVLVRILYMGMSNVEGDAAVQKKSYRAWWLLYDYATTAGTVPSSEEGAEVVEDDGIVTRAKAIDGALWSNPTFLHELLTKLMDPTVTVAVASKRDRLALMAAIVTCFQWPVEADSSVAAQWSQLLSFIPALISESILMTKEVSEKTRAAAYELLLAMGRKMIEMERESEGAAVIPMGAGDDAEADEDANSDTDEEKDKSGVEAPANLGEYMKMVMAGLAGKTPHMISATIHSLARMLFEFRQLEEGALDDELVRTVIQVVLIYAQESKSREIIKSAISFIKVVTVVCADLIEPTVGDDDDAIAMEQDGGDNGDDDEEAEDTGPFNYVKNIVRALLKWSSEHKSHFKVACRFVIEKMIRKFGFEALERYFPAEHHKLLTNIRKIRERKARRAAEGKLAAKDANQGPTSFADLMKEQGSDGEEEEEELMRGHGKGGDTVMHSDDDDEDIPEMLRELVGSKSQRRGRMSLAIREGADEEMADDSDGPVDFLDRKVISKLYTAKGAKGRGARGAAAKISSTMPMDKDGRFIVRDSEDEDASGDVPLTAEETAAAAAQGHYMASIKSKDAFRYSGDGKKIKFSNKRSRDGEDDGEDTAMALDTAAASTTARPTANAVSRTQRNTKKRCTAEQELAKANVRTTGKEYRSKRARGDVKREDMPDPYAYIPLNAKIVASGKGRRKNVHINRKLFDL